jgi:hypothetical protein
MTLTRRPRFGVLVTALASSLVLAVSALTAAGAPAAAYPVREPVTWHRVNTDQSNPAPQHERFRCVELRRHWTCQYDQVPEPGLNFDVGGGTSRFSGMDVTASWTCPSWFPADICQDVTQVVRGEILFVLDDGTELLIAEELVFTGANKDRKMYITFVDYGFSCPWYPTFRKALAANPFPLPFDGTHWPADDCLAASATAA